MSIEKLKVHGENEIEVKRLYLPLVVGIDCPHCGSGNEVDFNTDYLSYPITNTNNTVYTCCDNCDGEYEFDVNLSIELEVNSEARTA
mgnify:CR=1 FL=1|tara:strand:+ start:347 stop:607 length:261 start_codon:yes stop_codon:yes gene_type:complete